MTSHIDSVLEGISKLRGQALSQEQREGLISEGVYYGDGDVNRFALERLDDETLLNAVFLIVRDYANKQQFL